MTMTEMLEQNKEKLIRQLETASSPAQVRPVLETALDRMLYRYNEQCGDDRIRETAAGLIRTVRMSVPLVDIVSDVRVWERTASDGERKRKPRVSPLSVILLIAGAVCAAGMLLTQTTNLLRLPVALALFAASLVCFFLAGFFSRNTAGKPARERMTECVADSGSIYRTLHSVMLVIDQILDQAAMEEAYSGSASGRAKTPEFTDSELSLYAGLLEASYSRDSEYAFEKLAELKYYLHTKQIDVVDFSEEHSAWFDRMPSMTEGTLRPALVSGGKLLKKGLASA